MKSLETAPATFLGGPADGRKIVITTDGSGSPLPFLRWRETDIPAGKWKKDAVMDDRVSLYRLSHKDGDRWIYVFDSEISSD